MRFIKILTLITVIIIISSCLKEKGCKDPLALNYNPMAEEDNGTCIYGASKNNYGCLGFSQSANGMGSLGTTLFNNYYDQKFIEEIAIQSNFFSGIPASVYILYEPSFEQRNAYATSTGNILFGYHMFYYTISKFNELAAAGILAHEWGHRTQFVNNWSSTMTNPTLELEADAFSGYYMFMVKKFAWSQIQGYFNSTYATGDYNFNHPSHHGTPNQRLAAAYLGVQTAERAIKEGKAFTYNEIHNLFLAAIRDEILLKRLKKTSSEVSRIACGESSGIEIENHFTYSLNSIKPILNN